MKKHFLKIVIVCILFFSPLVVKANFGDLRYEITDVNISNSKITFKGWAFIHKTNNFNTVSTSTGEKTGGQKISMRVVDSSGNVYKTITVDGSDKVNYNFYCEMFYNGYGDSDGTASNGVANYNKYYNCVNKDGSSNDEYYKNFSYNSCSGTNDVYSQCYYEDMYFEITFDTSQWNVNEETKLNFQIAVSNDFYHNKCLSRSCKSNIIAGIHYTAWEDVSISDATISNTENDYIKIIDTSSKVKMIASSGLFWKIGEPGFGYFKYDYVADKIERKKHCIGQNGENKNCGCVYGSWDSSISGCGNIYSLGKNEEYPEGRGDPSLNKCFDFLGKGCKGSHFYIVRITKNVGKVYNGTCNFACPATDEEIKAGNYYTVVVRGAHIKPTGSFSINVKNDKKCEVDEPSPDVKCNNSGTLTSTCEALTVHTDSGSANVKITQEGIISNIMTPKNIYEGGGFNFGIMYSNNIKWSYVNSYPGDIVHKAITKAMNEKIKDYSSYIAGINISSLKLGDDDINNVGMVKHCITSSTNKNYYDKELTVNCIFTFPQSTINYPDDIKYNLGSKININNKYYTELKKYGDLDLTATIIGMDRIEEESAKSDSKENGKSWTGTWEASIDGCQINVYPLLYRKPDLETKTKYNFIYRPIELKNPFPDRNAGINWYDWYSNNNNKQDLAKLEKNELQYSVSLDNKTITDIKNNNKNNNYLNWDSINEDTEQSSFITDNSYIKRVGDN